MQKMIANQYRTTIVCVDAYDGSVPRGRIYNPALTGAKPFDSLMRFLLEMERLLDEMQFPQPFMLSRRFTDPAQFSQGGQDLSEPGRGALATFSVKVIFRQNASWQGSVVWLESGREESFRSVLELLLLMNSALTGDKP